MHYILTEILKNGSWSENGEDGKATIPAIIEYPTVPFDQAITFKRFIYVSQKSFKKTEDTIARTNKNDSDYFFVYIGASSRSDLYKIIEKIREIIIEESVKGLAPEYTTFWIDAMEVTSEHGKWVANGLIRGELYGGTIS